MHSGYPCTGNSVCRESPAVCGYSHAIANDGANDFDAELREVLDHDHDA